MFLNGLWKSTSVFMATALLATQIQYCKAFLLTPTPPDTIHSRSDQWSVYAVDQSNTEKAIKVEQPLWSIEELEEQALKSGIVISFTTLGPGYRAVARAKHNETLIMGYVEGFVRPSGDILHLDKMEVFKKMVKRARNEEPTMDFGGVSQAVGLILGYKCLFHGIEKGCRTAEFLAIDDEGMFIHVFVDGEETCYS
jgi:hypothetical protein